jgi:hypothetical protein
LVRIFRAGPELADGDDFVTECPGQRQPPQVQSEGVLPDRAQMIVQVAHQHGEDRGSDTPFDLGPVPVYDAEPERQEVVGDPVDASPCATWIFGYRDHALEEAERHEPVERSGGVGANGVGDLVVLRATAGHRVEDEPPQIAGFTLGGDDEFALGE